jgi:hypothetical protein
MRVCGYRQNEKKSVAFEKKLQVISLVENLGSWKKKEQGFESG